MSTFYGVTAIILWGSLAALSHSTKEIPAFQLLFICFSLSAVLMFLKRLLAKEKLLRKPDLTLKQWLISIYGLFGFHLCYFIAIKLAPAIEVSLISYLWPMIFALLLSTKANLSYTFVGGLTGFAGVSFIIIGDSEISFSSNYFLGYLLAGCCALIWSSYSYLQSKSNNKVEDIGWISMAVALLSLAAHWHLEETQWQFSATQWLFIFLLGAGPVGGAFYLWDVGVKQGNRNLLASLSYCAPLISALILAVFELSQWSLNILIALVLVLTGGLISQINNKRSENVSP